jgi:hypothetical protein
LKINSFSEIILIDIMFAWLKKLFSKKKELPQPMPPPAPAPEPVKQEPEKLEPKPEEIHKEKLCPHCSAPNDVFVSKCWMCKQAI